MDFKDIFLVTDADGTLLTDDRRILEKDKAAIREFTDGGGMFTIATGRGVSLAEVIVRELELQIPAIIFNGAVIYDYRRGEFVWKCTLPPVSRKYIRRFMDKFESIAVEVLRGDEVNVVRTNEYEERHITFGDKKPLRRGFDEVPPDNWIKALFIGRPDVIDELIAYAAKSDIDGVHLVRSAPIFYEMLPYGVNKGSGCRKLLELLGQEGRYVVAAGDFMNDIELLQTADLGVAVSNAENIVKEAADLIVCDNNSGAIWEIVEYLKG